MPKMKSKRALMKRVKVTGSGALKRKHAFMGHLAPNKTHKERRQLRKSGLVDKTDYGRIKYLIAK
jgi:large subunit ribosomal protein L35